MDVGRDDAVLDRQENRAAQAHVFADGGNGILDRVGNGLAGCRIGRSTDGLDRAVGAERYIGNAANDGLEGVVTGNEVRLRVDFDDDGLGAGAGNADQAFGSGTARLLVGLGDALGTQPVDRCFDVAVVFSQRLQIGRASCRGRVCPYWYIVVVAVALKKNYQVHTALA